MSKKQNKTIIETEPTTYLSDQRKKEIFWEKNSIFFVGLSVNALAVRMYLVMRANESRQCWPSLNTIAKALKISKPTVIKAINELTEKGLLEKIIRIRPNQEYQSTIYVIKDPPEVIEGGGKLNLPPVKDQQEGVVNNFNNLVNQNDNLVNEFDPNKDQLTISNEQCCNKNKDLSSLPSLRSGKEDHGKQKTAKVPAENGNLLQRESPPEKLLQEKVLSQSEAPTPKEKTFQKPENLISTVTNSSTSDQSEKAAIENSFAADNCKSVFSNKDIIGSLGDYFLEVPGMSEAYPPGPKRKRVYALMGRLYHRLDCEPVFRAIDALRRKIESGGSINDPLRYVAGIAEKCAKGPIKNDNADEMYRAIKEIGEKNALTEDKRAFIREWYAHEEKQAEEFFKKQREERNRLLSILERKYNDPLAEEIAEIQREYARKKIVKDRGKFKHVSSCLLFSGEAD